MKKLYQIFFIIQTLLLNYLMSLPNSTKKHGKKFMKC